MPLPQKTYLPSEVVSTASPTKPQRKVYDIPSDLTTVPDLHTKAEIQEWMGRFLQYQPDIIEKQQNETVTLVSSQAKEIGQDIPADWRLKIYPSAAGQTPYYEYITDDGWRITAGGEFISPVGKTMTYEDMLREIPRTERPESIFGEYKPATLPQKSYLPSQVVIPGTEAQPGGLGQLQQAIGDVFTISNQDVNDIIDWLVKDESNMDTFLEMIHRVGDTTETRQLLSSLGATESMIPEFFAGVTSEKATLDARILSGEIKISEPGLVFQETDASGQPFSAILKPDGTVRAFGRVIGKFDMTTGVYEDYSTQAVESMPTFARVWGAGWGSVFSGLSGVWKRIGWDSQAELTENFANSLTAADAPADIYDTKYDDWRMVIEPGFWWQQLRSLPFMQAGIIVGGGLGAVGGGAVASAVGAGRTATIIAQMVGAGIGESIPEGLMESGLAYEEMLARGFTREQANEAFDRILAKNIATLSATNSVTWIAALSGIKVPGGTLTSILSKAGGALSEGAEEVLQDIYTRQEYGDPIVWDKSMMQQFLSGTVMGGMFVAGGNIITKIQQRAYQEFTPELKETFDATKQVYVKQGLSETEAAKKALDDMITEPEVQQAVKKAVKDVQTAETRQKREQALVAGKEYIEEATDEGYADYQEMVGMEEFLNSDQLANERFNLGGRKVGIDAFISIREQNFPEYFTVKQAQALFPGHDFVNLTKKGRVPRDAALDDLTKRYNLSADEIAEKAEQIRQYKDRINELRSRTPVPEAKTEVEQLQEQIEQIKKDFTDKIKTAAEAKQALYDFVKDMPAEVKAKAMTQLKNVNDFTQLSAAFDKVGKDYEAYTQKQLKAKILSELKKARPTKTKQGIIKSKYTAEIQDKLSAIEAGLTGDRGEAFDKIANNISLYEDGKLSHEDMTESNETLSMIGIAEMSSVELENVLKNIQSIKETGKTLREAKDAVYKERITKVRGDVLSTLTGGKGLKPGTASLPSESLEAKTSKIGKLVNIQMAWDNLLDKASKLDRKSKPYQSVISNLGREAHLSRNIEYAGEEAAFKKVQDAIKSIFGVKSRGDMNAILNRMAKEKIELGTFEDLNGDKVTLSLTKNQIIKKYQELQDPTLEDTFREGMKWSFQMQQAIIRNLSSQEKAWADWQMKFYQEYYHDINRVYRDVYGVNLAHNPFYTPINRDVSAAIPENVLYHKDASRYASVLNGSLKSRVRNRNPLMEADATDVLVKHITEMEHFKAWAYTMMDLRRVFGNKEVRTAIAQYHGRDMRNRIDNYMNDFARGGIDKVKVNHLLDGLRRNFTRAILGLKPAIAIKQIPSVMAYMTEMSPADFVRGVSDFWTNPVEHYRFMMENSPYMRNRFGAGFERDIKYAMQTGKAKQITGGHNISDWFMILIRTGDKFAVTQGMWAKYKAELRQGKTQEEAIRLAEETTKRTQPTSEIETLSQVQRGGSFDKLFTMFQNQPNKYFRIIADNYRNFVYGRGSRAKAVSNILLVWVVLPALFQLVADGFRWRKEHQMRAWMLGPINYLLVIGQIAQAVYNRCIGETWDYEASPVFGTVNDILTTVSKASSLIKKAEDPFKQITTDDWVRMIEMIAQVSGQVGGVPTPYFIMVERALRSGNYWELIFSRYILQSDTNKEDPRITAITDQYKLLFAKYDGANVPDSIFYIEDADKRKEFRDNLLLDKGFADARRMVEAIEMGIPDNHTPLYVEYYSLPKQGYEQERFLLDHPGYYNDVWLGIQGNQAVDFDSVPSEAIEKLMADYNALPQGKDRLVFRHEHPELDEWGVAQGIWSVPVGDKWQSGEEVKEEETADITKQETTVKPETEKAEPTPVEIYAKEIIEYRDIPQAGYGNERFLKDNPDFYKDIWLGEWGNQEIDFGRIPTPEVERLYTAYQKLPVGTPRFDYRAKHPELDQWMLKVGKVSKLVGDRGNEAEEQSVWEETAETQAIKDYIQNLTP